MNSRTRSGGLSFGPDTSPPPVSRATALAAVALLVSIFAAFTALFVVFDPRVATPDERGEESRVARDVAEGDLLTKMTLFQRYVEKARLAADAGNWPLAAFYAEKIEENAVRVVDAGYVIDGVDVSAIADEVGVPRARALAQAADAADPARFEVAYGRMIDGCNTCHKRAGFRVVQIVPPDAARYPSQDFSAP